MNVMDMSYNTDLYAKLTADGYILFPEFNYVCSVDNPFPEDKMIDLELAVRDKFPTADIQVVHAGFDGNRQLNGVSVWIKPKIPIPPDWQN